MAYTVGFCFSYCIAYTVGFCFTYSRADGFPND
jgi:hypothetical protein